MAYVGTPSRLGSARDTLASIIQGEAGGEGLRGMQAVAQVITNRANLNFGGYGSDLVSQATARNQFQGQSSRISQSAYDVADQALAGNLPNVVGSGAVNYANPGASSARWATNLDSSNSFQLGNHFFTDNTKGIPYQPDLSPSATQGGVGGNTGPTAYSPPATANGIGGVETSAGSEITGFSSATGNPNDATEVTLGFPGDNNLNGTGTGTGGFDSTGGFTTANAAGGAGNGSFGLSGIMSGGSGVGGSGSSAFSLDGATLNSDVSASSVAGSGDNIAGYNAAGPVQANPALVGATNSVAQATTKGDQAITQGVTKAGQTIGQSITSASQSWLAWASDSFLRLAVIVFGVVIFAAGLYYFGKPAIDEAAQKVAKKMPAVIPV